MKNPWTLSNDEVARGAAGIRYLDAVAYPRHQVLFQTARASGLETDAAIEHAAVALVGELGDPLVQAIQAAEDGRVRTRAGAIKFLCRGWVSL